MSGQVPGWPGLVGTDHGRGGAGGHARLRGLDGVTTRPADCGAGEDAGKFVLGLHGDAALQAVDAVDVLAQGRLAYTKALGEGREGQPGGKPASSPSRPASSTTRAVVSPALGTAARRLQETQDGAGSDIGPLRLGIVPGLGHHDNLAAQGPRDPLAFLACGFWPVPVSVAI